MDKTILFNEQIKNDLNIPELYTQEDKGNEAIVYCKFFDILGSWVWYVTEVQQEGSDYLFFGLVNGIEVELGYFMLSELLDINKDFPRIERDLYFKPTTLAEIKQEIKSQR